MHIRKVTEADYPAIATIHSSLNIVWPEGPQTPEGWAEIDRKRHPKVKAQRWVAEVDGAVLGFASYSQSYFNYHPQRFHINVEVHPDYQRRGIGAALYDKVIADLAGFDPRVLRADAFTNLPQGFPFLHKRGFYEAFRETPVHLDIKTFDPSPYIDLEDKLLESGIRITTVPELACDPDRDRKIYELYHQVSEDVPQEGLPYERQSLGDWVKWALYDPAIVQEAYFIAVVGDEYVGLRELYQNPDTGALLGSLLGVRRDYRRRGLGLALQLRGIAYARERGIPVLKTCTAVQNAPMQTIFNKLGYQRDPEWLQCQKDILP